MSWRQTHRRGTIGTAFIAGLSVALAAGASQAADLKDCRTGLQLFPSDRARVDPELLTTMAALTASSSGGAIPATPAARREAFADGFKRRQAAAPQPPAGVSKQERRIPGPPGAPPIRVLIYTPEAPRADRPALLDIHGGSYILGFPEMNETRNLLLAKALGAVIVSIDYRLAPEHPYPAAVEDSYAALEWLNASAKELGVDPAKVAISGDSAGGGIAASLALMVRDRGKIPLKAQVLIYPNVDDRPYTVLDPTCAPGTGAPRGVGAIYLGRVAGQNDVPAYAFAARAESVAGLAPAFIAVGAVDGLVDQDIAYAQRLIQAGVPTELHVYPGAFHGFDIAVGASVTHEFHDDLMRALRRAWGLPANAPGH